MPWPNRVDGGRYEFRGTSHQLPITEVEKGNALHGLVGWSTWTVVEHADDHAVLRFELPPQPGYPFALDVEADYRLSDAGLEVVLRATNAGGSPAPYGVGIHPYLTVGRRLDECVLSLPASQRCPTTERGLPEPPEPVLGTPYDFREARRIGATVFDHPFTGLGFTPAGPRSGCSIPTAVVGWSSASTTAGPGSRSSAATPTESWPVRRSRWSR